MLPTGHGRVAPISRDDVAAAVAAVAAKPNKSRIIYMITGHRALGFGEIAASYGETIVRQVPYHDGVPRRIALRAWLGTGRVLSTLTDSAGGNPGQLYLSNLISVVGANG